MLAQSTSLRLARQLEAVPLILAGAAPEAITTRPASGKWSAHENLAHLLRHHELFLERIRRIAAEDAPALERYRAEDDPEWPARAALPTADVLARLAERRAELVALIGNLSPGQLARVGVHPVFGAMTVPLWVEFFLLHEAHHLYVVMSRIHGA